MAIHSRAQAGVCASSARHILQRRQQPIRPQSVPRSLDDALRRGFLRLPIRDDVGQQRLREPDGRQGPERARHRSHREYPLHSVTGDEPEHRLAGHRRQSAALHAESIGSEFASGRSGTLLRVGDADQRPLQSPHRRPRRRGLYRQRTANHSGEYRPLRRTRFARDEREPHQLRPDHLLGQTVRRRSRPAVHAVQRLRLQRIQSR